MIELNTDLFPHEARDSEVSDSSPDSEPPAPPPIESNWAPIMEFTAADIFQHSPFGDILNSLSISRYPESPSRITARMVGMQTTKKFRAHPPPTW